MRRKTQGLPRLRNDFHHQSEECRVGDQVEDQVDRLARGVLVADGPVVALVVPDDDQSFTATTSIGSYGLVPFAT
jgi:hypothetical protein